MGRQSEVLKAVAQGGVTLSLTGCTTTPTGTVRHRKHGGIVHLSIPAITGTSNTTAATLTGLPRQLWPTATRRMFGARYDNGTLAVFPIEVSSAGVITLFDSMTTSNGFTAAGTKGIGAQELAYLK